MPESQHAIQRYRFGEFTLNLCTRELTREDGQTDSLTAKAFDTLCYLVEHRDRLASKDELLAAIWPDRVVEENNLNQAISALRSILGTGAKDRRFIVTVPGKGYRFVAEVSEESAAEVSAKRLMTSKSGLKYIWIWLTSALVIGTSIVLLTIYSRLPDTPTEPSLGQVVNLAVLPFRSLTSLSSDPLLEFGLADTLVAQLSRNPHLRVRSLQSSTAMAAQHQDPLNAGKQLQVDYLIDGSTQLLGNTLRVNVRLVNIVSGETIWANTIDELEEKIFDLQDGLSKEITEALAVESIGTNLNKPSPCEGENFEARRALLTARYIIRRPVAVRLPDALAAYQRAIDLDPTCASAYAGIASIYRSQTITGDRDPREAMPLALEAIEKAITLDPYSAEAYSQLGFIQLWYKWDWVAAESSFSHAFNLAPNLALTHFGYAGYYVFMGQFKEGLKWMNHALNLDPVVPLYVAIQASMLEAAGYPIDAQHSLQNAFELDGEYWLSFYIRGGMTMDSQGAQAAIADLEQAAKLSGGNSQVLGLLVMAYAGAGNRDKAMQLAHSLESRSKERYVPSSALAAAQLGLGNTEKALDLLEQAFRQKEVRMAYLAVDARWNPIRQHPRFRDLLRKLKLPVVKGLIRF